MRLRELAILVIGAHWKAEYEWFAHAPIAEKQGVPAAVIAAIGRGETPPFDDDADRTVHAFVREVVTAGKASDMAFAAARALLGDKGVVELTALVGYYSLLAFQLNVFQSLPPPPFKAPWD
jgi:4-carboxymuconolactone decarboxylase